MLIRSLGLQQGNATPGIKETDVKYDAIRDELLGHEDANVDMTNVDDVPDAPVISSLKKPKRNAKHVSFGLNVQHFKVPACSTIFGRHPKEIVATRRGKLELLLHDPDPFTSKSKDRMHKRCQQVYPRERCAYIMRERGKLSSTVMKRGIRVQRGEARACAQTAQPSAS